MSSENPPLSIETVPHAEVQRRMREQRWRYEPSYSTGDRYLYYSRSTRTWVTIEPAGGFWTVTHYAACACNNVRR